jgi:hypothetical protein
LAYLGEVGGGLFGGSKGLAGGVGGKGSVGDALDVKFLFAEPEEFAIHADARARGCRDCHAV